MQTINANILTQNMVHTTYPRIYEIVNSQLLELNMHELMLVYEMIRLIKQPHESKKEETEIFNFPFQKVQEALKGISGNLSDDIINIEREDRV